MKSFEYIERSERKEKKVFQVSTALSVRSNDQGFGWLKHVLDMFNDTSRISVFTYILLLLGLFHFPLSLSLPFTQPMSLCLGAYLAVGVVVLLPPAVVSARSAASETGEAVCDVPGVNWVGCQM